MKGNMIIFNLHPCLYIVLVVKNMWAAFESTFSSSSQMRFVNYKLEFQVSF